MISALYAIAVRPSIYLSVTQANHTKRLRLG